MLTHHTLSVLAGAYRGARLSLAHTLTHSVAADAADSERAICGQRNMADVYSADEDERAAAPTCPKCLAKLARLAVAK